MFKIQMKKRNDDDDDEKMIYRGFSIHGYKYEIKKGCIYFTILNSNGTLVTSMKIVPEEGEYIMIDGKLSQESV
jgi:hypothetical protein